MRIHCASNLRQLGMAIHMYAHDNKGKYCPQGTIKGELWGAYGTYEPKLMTALVEKYKISPPVMTCPVFRTRYDYVLNYQNGYWDFVYIPYIRGWISSLKDEPTGPGAKSTYALMADWTKLTWTNHLFSRTYLPGEVPPDPQGGNVLYNDGHVVWKMFKEMDRYRADGQHPIYDYFW